MMEIEDKLRVHRDLFPLQTHLWEKGGGIEFSSICLCSTTDTTSTDPINHRNGPLRTCSNPRNDVSRYSSKQRLSSERFTFKCARRNFGEFNGRTIVLKG